MFQRVLSKKQFLGLLAQRFPAERIENLATILT
jgi:hypothetical protein